jgi:hypothetical protein
MSWDPAQFVEDPDLPFKMNFTVGPNIKEEPWRPGDCRKHAAKLLRGSLASPSFPSKQPQLGDLLSKPPEDPSKPPRIRANAKQYYEMLMAAHNKREEDKLKAADENEKFRREAVAHMYKKNHIKAEKQAIKAAERQAAEDAGQPLAESTPSLSSVSTQESEEWEDPDGFQDKNKTMKRTHTRVEKLTKKEIEDLPVTAYDGLMEVELEVVVVQAYGTDEAGSSIGDPAEASSKTASSAGSPRESDEDAERKRQEAAEELARLREELGDDNKEEEEDEDGLPDSFGIQNAWSNPDPRWSLGLGGTVFFVPHAERYAHAPSLPPPPPPSLLGRRRLRLKPRLPLAISNHRYRDEHPNIFPEAPFNPNHQHRSDFERTLVTYDFYASCSKAIASVPLPERASEEEQYQQAVGRYVDEETRRSDAWRHKLMREDLKRKRKALREEKRRQMQKELEAQAKRILPKAS